MESRSERKRVKVLQEDKAPENGRYEGEFHEIPQASNEVEMGAFKAGLRIDKHNLDEEVMQQPQTFSDLVDAVALARSRRDLLKDELNTIEADLGLTVRAEKDEAGEKCTEKLIESYVQVSKRRIKAFRRLIDAERTLIELEGYKDASRDRSFMLRELVQMHLQQNFQSSSVNSQERMQKDATAYNNQAAMAEKRRERSRS